MCGWWSSRRGRGRLHDMSVPSPNDPVIQELTSLDARVAEVLKDRDSASRLLQLLPEKYDPQAVLKDNISWRASVIARVRCSNISRPSICHVVGACRAHRPRLGRPPVMCLCGDVLASSGKRISPSSGGRTTRLASAVVPAPSRQALRAVLGACARLVASLRPRACPRVAFGP